MAGRVKKVVPVRMLRVPALPWPGRRAWHLAYGVGVTTLGLGHCQQKEYDVSQDTGTSFSRRFGYRSPHPEITIREDAPPWLRSEVLRLAQECGMSDREIREVVCRRLRKDPSDWRNAWDEAVELLSECEWHKVYDVAEDLYKELATYRPNGKKYEDALNCAFEEGGIGWQMRSGTILVRGSEPFDAAVRDASSTLVESGRPTAAGQIEEAFRALSRRPVPNPSGAIHHAVAALECVARDLAGDTRSTLGKLIENHSDEIGIVPPLDQALAKLWGYASEQGRHLREGREPSFDEAELVVTVAASVSTYLSKKFRG